MIALAFGLLASSPCFSQTISLGGAGQYSIFEATEPGVTPGSVSVGSSSIAGSVAVGAGTTLSIDSATTIGGAVYEDSNITASVLTTVPGGVQTGTNLAQAATDAANAASTAAGLPVTINPNDSLSSFSSNTIYGNPGVNVVDFAQGLFLDGATFTINGTSSEQFVFNVSQYLLLTDTSIVLNGVSASNVSFNIIDSTGSGTGVVSISGGTFYGTILDLVAGNPGDSVSLSGDPTGGILTLNGSIISDASISISNSSIGLPSEPNVTPAPELPTNIMAGLACLLLVVWNAGRNLLRRRRLTPASP